jgi:serine/threonine-protein kinase
MQAGDKLGHFEIVSKLGAGGMGEVYLARDPRLERQLAIKILPADLADDAHRQARFATEAKAVSALSHPNIAQIFDIGEQDGIHFIAMEYVEGPDLGQRLAGPALAQNEIIAIAIQVAGALEEARSKGVIHRDIKPANIALTARAEVKVLDFGLAKMTGPADKEPSLQTMTLSRTAAGAVLGTVRYMSPEQARGKDVDTRSDLFSLGVVLYEMATGQPPFGGAGPVDTIDAILNHPPAVPARADHELTGELERIIRKCLEKDPENRYQTPRDLLVDLRNLKRANESGSTVAGAAPPVKAGRRPLVPVLTILAVAVVAVAAYFMVPRASADVRALVVLPFENATNDPEIEYLCNGVTESLINTLAQFAELRVISRRSAFAVKGDDLDPETIGRKLGVDAILYGRMVLHGDELDISTELVDARDGRQLWGSKYSRPVGEVQSVENEITVTIAKTLKIELAGEGADLLASHGTDDPEAYRLYLKGREFTVGTMREMDKAIDLFKEAIDREPGYALAWAGLAQSYTHQCFLRGSERDETVSLARAAAARAMELDPDLAEAFTASGLIKMYFDLDWQGARADLQRGVELGPGSVVTLTGFGDFQLFSGDYEAGVEWHDKALAVDPLSISTLHDLGFTYMALKRYDRSEYYFRKALDLNPNWTWGHIKLAKTLMHMDRCEEALAATAVAEDLLAGSSTPAARCWLDFTYARCGETEKARAGLAQLQDRSGSEYVDPSLVAITQLGLGDLEGAIVSLEQSLAERSPNLVFYKLLPDIYLDALGDDPRFQAMARKTGFE